MARPDRHISSHTAAVGSASSLGTPAWAAAWAWAGVAAPMRLAMALAAVVLGHAALLAWGWHAWVRWHRPDAGVVRAVARRAVPLAASGAPPATSPGAPPVASRPVSTAQTLLVPVAAPAPQPGLDSARRQAASLAEVRLPASSHRVQSLAAARAQAAAPAAPAVEAAASGAQSLAGPADAASAIAAASAPEAPMPAPAYPVRLPPADELHFVARRGDQQGDARLRWQPGGDGHYQLEWTLHYEGEVKDAIHQTSSGAFEDQGMAPLRYTDQRARSGTRAINFQREAGLLSYSASTATWPLLPRVQDRLSWWVQLAGIVAAWRQAAHPGDRIGLLVAGVRGELERWDFVVVGYESTFGAAAGELHRQSLHLSRAPLHRFDNRIDVWLDDQAPCWPTQLRFSYAQGEPLELVLRRDPVEARAVQQR